MYAQGGSDEYHVRIFVRGNVLREERRLGAEQSLLSSDRSRTSAALLAGQAFAVGGPGVELCLQALWTRCGTVTVLRTSLWRTVGDDLGRFKTIRDDFFVTF